MLGGSELAKMSLEDFEREVDTVRVYARINPEQKIKIVRALQDKGEFVAMTGDGVNDAPALKQADIGVAMGKGGTDVAREAAHMTLLDDNFATIVTAVREGRRIFDNIRKFVKYTMTSNSGEIWTIFLAPFLGLPIPLLPIHILWINLVTDGLPGLALAGEGAERNVMQRPPRPPKESIFAHGMWQHILWVGLLMGAVTLLTQAWALHSGSAHWQSMVFTVLTLSQLGHVLAIRSERESLFTQGVFSNRMLVAALALTFALQMAVLYVPWLNPIFKTAPLSVGELAACLALSSVVFLGVELEKALLRRGWLYRGRCAIFIGSENDHGHAAKVDQQAEDVLHDRCQRPAAVGRVGSESGQQPRQQQPENRCHHAGPGQRQCHCGGQVQLSEHHPDHRKRQQREHQADQQAGAQLAADELGQAHMAQRQAAHGHRLALRADGVGQVHQAGHEERQRRHGGQRRFETRDDESGHHAAHQAHQEPGQAVPNPPHRRLFDGLARPVRLARDAGQAVQVFDVLATQDLHQPGRTDHADQAACRVDDRHGRHAVVQGDRGHLLLVGARQDADTVAACCRAEFSFVGQCQQFRCRQRAEQSLVRFDHTHQFPGALLTVADLLAQRRGRIAGVGQDGVGPDVVGGGLAIRLVQAQHLHTGPVIVAIRIESSGLRIPRIGCRGRPPTAFRDVRPSGQTPTMFAFSASGTLHHTRRAAMHAGAASGPRSRDSSVLASAVSATAGDRVPLRARNGHPRSPWWPRAWPPASMMPRAAGSFPMMRSNSLPAVSIMSRSPAALDLNV